MSNPRQGRGPRGRGGRPSNGEARSKRQARRHHGDPEAAVGGHHPALTAAIDKTLERIKPTLPRALRSTRRLPKTQGTSESAIPQRARSPRRCCACRHLIHSSDERADPLITLKPAISDHHDFPWSSHWFGMSVNTMTLGGLAVAIGELVGRRGGRCGERFPPTS